MYLCQWYLGKIVMVRYWKSCKNLGEKKWWNGDRACELDQMCNKF